MLCKPDKFPQTQIKFSLLHISEEIYVNRDSCPPKALRPRFITQLPRRSTSNVQYPAMSPFLPFDIIALRLLIIEIVGEKKGTDLLKKLALVSHYFL